MKIFLANLAIALGALVVAWGLICVPAIQDLIPVDFVDAAENQALYRHFRAVPTVWQGHHFLPYAMLFAGLVILVIAVVIRRRLRGTAV